MVQVAQDLKKFTALQLAQYAEDRATALENNATIFPAPNPTPTQLRVQATALRTGLGTVDDAKIALTVAYDGSHAVTEALKDMLNNEGTYVQGVANAGDNTDEQATTIIKTSGMSVKAAGTPVGVLPAPADLSLTQGDETGEVDAHCHSVKSSSFYQWESSLDADPNAASWTIRTPTTKSSTTLKDFASGAIVWVRVRAGGADGPGPASAPVSIRVA